MELRMIRVLIVEDSAVIRDFLRHILSADPEIHVIGTAADGEAALDAVQYQKPDVITMDIHMPRMNGLEATRHIMETHPTPIVVVSSSMLVDEVTTSFRAIEAGALAAVPRPQGLGHPEHQATAQELVHTV
jgi:two-component system chemotaxis response regulator CheB